METKVGKVAGVARENADNVGVGGPAVIMWAAQTFLGVEVDITVAMLLAGMLASAGAKVRAGRRGS